MEGEIDAAALVELKAFEHQKPMNDVIDRGDSPIQQYYDGTTVFITGGSGFIGKQLIEKLLRSCNIKRIYTLTRPKKGQTIEQRLETTLQNNVYDAIREKRPNFAEKIVAIEGNIDDIDLSISEGDRATLTNEVNVIFHAAATVRFDEPFRKATLTNIRGTREVLELARQCKNLKKFVHVSTAFTHATEDRIKQDVLEKFYPCPIRPDIMIQMAEEVEEKRLDGLTNSLMQGWPNTYTFTKAVGEELIRSTAGDLPVCIVRPPIVIPSYCEPKPGWLEKSTLAGPSGIYLSIALGILNVFCVDLDTHLAMAPVDLVNNAIIASSWDSTERAKNGEKEIPIYTIAIKDVMQWKFLGSTMRALCRPLLSTPKSVWRSEILEVKSRKLYTVLSWFLHYIPAFILDGICTVIGKKPKEVTSFVSVYKLIDKLGGLYYYYLNNEWEFKDDNLRAMIERMNDADRAIFNANLRTMDKEEYVLIWGVGLRKYILKDGLTGTKAGVRKQNVFQVLNYIAIALYLYGLWLIFSTIFNVVVSLVI